MKAQARVALHDLSFKAHGLLAIPLPQPLLRCNSITNYFAFLFWDNLLELLG
jgi:hypothetical protein